MIQRLSLNCKKSELIMKIKDTRVYLRAFEPDDYKTSIQWRNDADVTNQLGGVKSMYLKVLKKSGWRLQ